MNKIIALLSREHITKAENIIRKGIYYLLPLIAIATLLYALFTPGEQRIQRQSERAELGRNLLILILFIKPIMVISKGYLPAQQTTIGNFLLTIKNLPKTLKQPHNLTSPWRFILDGVYSLSTYLMRFRRELGIACFWILLVHGMLIEIFWAKLGNGIFSNIGQTTIWTGTIGLLALLIGAITSNTYALKKLTTNWKKVQMIAYIAFIFAAIHIGHFGILIVYLIAKGFERKKTGQYPRHYLQKK